jgi:hypothetical protein
MFSWQTTFESFCETVLLKNTTPSSRRTETDRKTSPVDRLRVHDPVVAAAPGAGDRALLNPAVVLQPTPSV